MTRHHDPLLSPLAASLAQTDWTAPGLRRHLTARLPRALTRSIPAAARHLLRKHPGTTTPDAGPILATLRAMALTDRLRDHHRKTGATPAHILTPPPVRPTQALAALNLPRLTTTADLADWLALTPDHLIQLA